MLKGQSDTSEWRKSRGILRKIDFLKLISIFFIVIPPLCFALIIVYQIFVNLSIFKQHFNLFCVVLLIVHKYCAKRNKKTLCEQGHKGKYS